jgi:hypothetical protein
MAISPECENRANAKTLRKAQLPSWRYVMIKVVAFVFSATIFAFALTQEASALRRGGIHAGDLRGGSFRGAYRGGLRVGDYRGYRAAGWGGRRYWNGGRRWYGYAGRPYWAYGAAALAGAYYNYPAYSYSYMSPSAYAGTGTAQGAEQAERAPGTCGTYFYWKDGSCVDARGK